MGLLLSEAANVLRGVVERARLLGLLVMAGRSWKTSLRRRIHTRLNHFVPSYRRRGVLRAINQRRLLVGASTFGALTGVVASIETKHVCEVLAELAST